MRVTGTVGHKPVRVAQVDVQGIEVVVAREHAREVEIVDNDGAIQQTNRRIRLVLYADRVIAFAVVVIHPRVRLVRPLFDHHQKQR